MDLSFELFRVGFLSVTLIDVIDIVVVAAVLYWVYSVMRGTIAAQIFIGLVVIVVVSVISEALNMKLLSTVLRTVSDIWVLAIIILFQPELRRILLMLGRRGLFRSFERYDVNRTIEELVEATEELSLRRWGALVVLTRSTDISLTVDTGVPIDARLSSDMIVSIFNPKSPLHDGAVVVSGEQVRFARVVLPLSPVMLNADVRLGTRHRAGLGISEQADVFVIIVSEETGNVSYAVGGNLYYNQSIDSLRLELIKAFEVVISKYERRRRKGDEAGGAGEDSALLSTNAKTSRV
jgi:diadenylate cyclase